MTRQDQNSEKKMQREETQKRKKIKARLMRGAGTSRNVLQSWVIVEVLAA